MRQRSSRAALALAAAVALATGCATLTPEDESRLGARMHYQLQYETPLLGDRVVSAYVERLGQRIAAAAGPSPTGYRFFVTVDDDINAFAAPGGYVYVNTGTILRARNVSELAGVLAHEIGHVAKRHVAANVERRQAANTVRQVGMVAGAVAAGAAGASAASLLGGVATLAALNSFGRDAERQADAFAAEVMPRAGYDPEGLVTFFQTLLGETQPGDRGSSFLSDHPATEERIEEARKAIDVQSLPEELERDDNGRLEIIQRRIGILTGGPAPATLN
jgi:beta-barrel assembly-enhancing protease